MLRKIQTLRVNNSRILMIQNAKLSGCYFYINLNIWGDFQICISVPLNQLMQTFSEDLDWTFRGSHPEMFIGKNVLKICSKFTEEHPCRSVISINLQSNFIEITLWHGCSAVNLLNILRTPFLRNTSGWLLLSFKHLTESKSNTTSMKSFIFM